MDEFQDKVLQELTDIKDKVNFALERILYLSNAKLEKKEKLKKLFNLVKNRNGKWVERAEVTKVLDACVQSSIDMMHECVREYSGNFCIVKDGTWRIRYLTETDQKKRKIIKDILQDRASKDPKEIGSMFLWEVAQTCGVDNFQGQTLMKEVSKEDPRIIYDESERESTDILGRRIDIAKTIKLVFNISSTVEEPK